LPDPAAAAETLPLPAPSADAAETLPAGGSSTRARVPARLGDYEIEAELGSGAMGTVFRARQVSLDRAVAIKIMQAGAHAGSERRERFQLEARAAARLRHAHLVAIHEVNESADGVPYLVMDLVDGESLEALLSRGPLPGREAAALIAPLAEALNYAHGQMILHRDVKPANVVLDQASGQPLLTDFGLAKHLDSSQGGPTVTGQVVGTPSYMAPEQARGGLLDARTDVYGLGATLYHCLTGEAPFSGGTILEVIGKVVDEEPEAPSRRVAVEPDLETICLACLAKDPDERYANAGALAADLRRYLGDEPIEARRPSLLQRELRALRRNQKASRITTFAVVVLVVAFGGVLRRLISNANWRLQEVRLRSRLASDRMQGVAALADKDPVAAAETLLVALIREEDARVQGAILGVVATDREAGRYPPGRKQLGWVLSFLERDDLDGDVRGKAWALARELASAGHQPPEGDDVQAWRAWWSTLAR
jgi:serine/threonine protein kinase